MNNKLSRIYIWIGITIRAISTMFKWLVVFAVILFIINYMDGIYILHNAKYGLIVAVLSLLVSFLIDSIVAVFYKFDTKIHILKSMEDDGKLFIETIDRLTIKK